MSEAPRATSMLDAQGTPGAPTREDSLGAARLSMPPPPQYPAAMVNVTKLCNLAFAHCVECRDAPRTPQ